MLPIPTIAGQKKFARGRRGNQSNALDRLKNISHLTLGCGMEKDTVIDPLHPFSFN
jgi:hypothetical protein